MKRLLHSSNKFISKYNGLAICNIQNSIQKTWLQLIKHLARKQSKPSLFAFYCQIISILKKVNKVTTYLLKLIAENHLHFFLLSLPMSAKCLTKLHFVPKCWENDKRNQKDMISIEVSVGCRNTEGESHFVNH